MNQPPSPSGSRGGRRALFAVLAILLSLLATALIGEGALRLAGYSPSNVNPLKSFHEFDPVIGWRGRKLYTARFKRPDFDVLVAQNAAGFRRQENLDAKLDKAPHRIFVFGDSFVWGWGVGQGEVFTDKMNLLLPNYSVNNYGINGTGTVVEYELFRTEVSKLVRPDDVVIVMFCNNDFADNVDRSKLHAEAANAEVKTVNPAKPLTNPLGDWFKNHSYLCNYVWFRADLYRLTRVNRKQEDEVLRNTMTETDERFIVVKHFLAKFQADCEAAKARFLLVHIPTQEEFSEARTKRPNLLANEKARAETLFSIARALHIETFDLLPGFLARKNKVDARLTFPNDGHWNSTGHQAVADLLSEYLSNHPTK
ncbi:MAG: SGNH/GDSL hydrolase family protein [Verrucomicrobia bacterium]|nr:SGNH/GDSL hydrolase family protein [Verrucomicrobiota bacterium]